MVVGVPVFIIGEVDMGVVSGLPYITSTTSMEILCRINVSHYLSSCMK